MLDFEPRSDPDVQTTFNKVSGSGGFLVALASEGTPVAAVLREVSFLPHFKVIRFFPQTV